MYGRTYIEAARKASDIVQSTGVDALVNDDLVGSVLTMVTIRHTLPVFYVCS